MLDKKTLVVGILVVLAMTGLAENSQAQSIASAAITVDDLFFESSDSRAELFWYEEIPSDPFSGWRGDVYVQAQDTLSGTDADAAEVFGDNAHIVVDAQTQLVTSIAEYKVVNGPEVAKGGGTIEIITGTGLNIPDDTIAQASGEAVGSFDNFFWVSGGMPGETVDVTFTLDYHYILDAYADELGYWEMYVFALLEIEDLYDIPEIPGVPGSGDIDNVDDFVDDFILRFESGSNIGFYEEVQGMLSVSATLEYEKEYFLFAAAAVRNRVPTGRNWPTPSYLTQRSSNQSA